jgi:hypothetical protein
MLSDIQTIARSLQKTLARDYRCFTHADHGALSQWIDDIVERLNHAEEDELVQSRRAMDELRLFLDTTYSKVLRATNH